MQQIRRSNRDRSETTRAALIARARALFVEKGYAGTSTPDIAEAAGVSRGALYHQFDDKHALFVAVIAAEYRAATEAIEAGAAETTDAEEALLAGGDAYLTAMRAEGRTRLLLIEAPAVIGVKEARDMDAASAAATLLQGLQAARTNAPSPNGPPEELAATADLLSAAFDRAALAIDRGGDEAVYRQAIAGLVRGALRQ
ncbi:TetR/AcrR family transcriptional regulator [Pleomorphomonas sp. PLEO]|uniref:TetR/AcrR family transcriptional regulator n=1 Tax=Pleomorphomonas sp. PLEO TaxID=3239306 RepID=UPI00351EC17B